MNSAHPHYLFIRTAALLALGVLFPAAILRAADAPPAAPPAPAPAAPAAGTWFVFSPPKEGVVLSPPSREKLLTVVKSFLDRATPSSLTQITGTANPFYPKLPTPAAPSSAAPSTSPSASVPTSAQQTPLEKLQQVADQLKPSGALIGGQTRLMIMANGDTLAVGQTLNVNFPGDTAPTEIRLLDVSSDSFTLKLGDATKAFPYVAKENALRSNPTSSPSQPKKP